MGMTNRFSIWKFSGKLKNYRFVENLKILEIQPKPLLWYSRTEVHSQYQPNIVCEVTFDRIFLARYRTFKTSFEAYHWNWRSEYLKNLSKTSQNKVKDNLCITTVMIEMTKYACCRHESMRHVLWVMVRFTSFSFQPSQLKYLTLSFGDAACGSAT